MAGLGLIRNDRTGTWFLGWKSVKRKARLWAGGSFQSSYTLRVSFWWQKNRAMTPVGNSVGAPLAHFLELPTEAFPGTEDSFQALMQQPHVGIAQCDLSGRFTRVNRRWADMLGYSEAELRQRSFLDVTHPESVEKARERLLTAQSGRLPEMVTVERRYVRKDGSTFWARAAVGALRDEKGVRGYIAMLFDLTSERRNRFLVESQNEAMQLTISGAPLSDVFRRLIAAAEFENDCVCSVLLLDAEGKHFRTGAAPGLPDDYNRAVETITIAADIGTCADAAVRNKIVITTDLADAPSWAKFKDLPLSLGLKAAWSMPIVSAQGRVFGTFGTYFRQCRGPTEGEIETVAVLTKLAALAIERREAEQSLRAARDEALAALRAKDDFLATVSHELRTPLNPVLLLASEGAANASLPAEARADFAMIEQNVALEKRLIDDLLDLSSIAHHKLKLQFAPQNVHNILQRAIGVVQQELRDKNLALTVAFNAPTSTVHGDGVRLQQIFWNLLRNAVKFTPESGRIYVTTRRSETDAGKLVIEVRDSGLGLTPFEQRTIFKPFIQGDHAAESPSRYGGLGIGLAISRELTALHHGKLSVASSGRNQGATFTVELPLLSTSVV